MKLRDRRMREEEVGCARSRESIPGPCFCPQSQQLRAAGQHGKGNEPNERPKCQPELQIRVAVRIKLTRYVPKVEC